MRQEIDEIPAAAARLLAAIGPAADDFAARFRTRPPAFLATIARGSSDHAALFLKYAFELALGLPGASLGPSLASIYGVVPHTASALVLALSQSGRSPDIVAMAGAARHGGGLTVALVNTLPSPLADAADLAIDIAAGPERSVAATKSFVCTALAGLALLARVAPDRGLAAALPAFPQTLADALACDWVAAADALASASSAFVLGRGPTLAIAAEIALKLKETCGLHAEAYSAAEVMHGPVELVTEGFPVLALAVRDPAEAGVATIADRLAGHGAAVFASTPRVARAMPLALPAAGHPLLEALCAVVPAYGLAEALSRRRGRDPDRPARLAKVTETR